MKSFFCNLFINVYFILIHTSPPKTSLYYYEIKTDEKPNIDNVNYTKDEKEGNFSLKYIPLENIENELINNAKTFENSRGIANEMIEIIKLYKNQIDK